MLEDFRSFAGNMIHRKYPDMLETLRTRIDGQRHREPDRNA